MPAIDVKSLWKFAVYATPQEYEAATGKPCPTYDPTRPYQAWEDPGVDDSELFVTYEHVLQQGKDGKWKVGPLTIPTAWAKSVNIVDASLPSGAVQKSIQPPWRRGLAENEILVDNGPFGGIQVWDRTEYVEQKTNVDAFTKADRDLLMKIARKVGAV